MSLTGLQLGHFRLKQRIGKSASEVYLAEDLRIGREVALKVAQIDIASFPTNGDIQKAINQFNEEAKIVSRLENDYILQLYEYGEETIDTTIYTYLVMPHKKDGSLERWIVTHTGSIETLLSLQDINSIIQMAAEALQYIHDQDIKHLDVKPSNFLVEHKTSHLSYPRVLLSDFGIAKLTNAGTTTTIKGTAQYMPPEQWKGHPTKESDQYALAIIAYQLLTGKLPFEGDHMQLAYQHAFVRPQPPTQLNPSLPHAIDAVIKRALAKDPKDRYPSIKQFAHALQAAILQPPVHVLGQAHVRKPLPSSTPPIKPPPPPPSLIKKLLLASLASLLIIGAIFYFVLSSLKPPPIPPAQLTATAKAIANQRATALVTATDITQATASAYFLQTATADSPRYTDPLTNQNSTTTTNASWSGGSNDSSSLKDFCKFEQSGYHVIVNYSSQDPQPCIETGQSFTYATYTISVDMTIIGNASAGLVFREQNDANDHGYFFEVSPNKQQYKISILYCDNNNCKAAPNIQGWGWTTSPSIQQNTKNTLVVVVDGDTFTFYINGKPLYVAKSGIETLYPNDYLGFACAVNHSANDTTYKGEAIFSNLNVYSPDQSQ